jgi:hypothetical protein
MDVIEFDECFINPMDIAAKQYIWEKYDSLKKRKVFCTLPKNAEGSDWYKGFSKRDLNSLIQFIVVFVDSKSPLAPERDFNLRMQKTVEVVSPTEKAMREIINETDLFQDMVFKYFLMTNQLEFEIWYSKMQAVHNMTKVLRRPLTIDALDTDVRAIKSATDVIGMLESDLKNRGAMLFRDSRLEKIIMSRSSEDDLTGYAEEYAQAPPYQLDNA